MIIHTIHKREAYQVSGCKVTRNLVKIKVESAKK